MDVLAIGEIGEDVVEDVAHPAHHRRIVGSRHPEIRGHQPCRHDTSETIHNVNAPPGTRSRDEFAG